MVVVLELLVDLETVVQAVEVVLAEQETQVLTLL